MKHPFPVDPVLTGIVIAYANQALIADQVLPRVPVGGREFKWLKYNIADGFTVPDTTVGRKGAPNEVEFGATEDTSMVRDYGLDDVVPVEDVEAAPPGYNPLGRAAEGLMDLILLDREKRVADLVFNPATYPAGRKVQLATTDKWSEPDATSTADPVEDIEAGLEAPMMRPNVMVLGHKAWRYLRRNPKIIASVYPQGGNAATGGVASRQAVADLFELDEIIIGQGYINTAKPGQAPNIVRVWGNHCALLHRNRLATNQRGITFGITAQHGTRVGGQIAEPKVGLRGATRVRSGESVRELIVAADVGYFIQDAA